MNKKLLILNSVLLAALILAEILLSHGHPDHFPGLEALLGLFGGILLMVFAKSISKFFLTRKPDYYADAWKEKQHD